MTTNYVLVDFENVQPDTLAALAGGNYNVKVFVGATQARGRISFELSHSMQQLGANAEYVKMARSGPNAMDMHIAYYVGRLLEKDPGAVIHIVSRDTDFDPLVEFLQGQNLACKRVKTVAEIVKAPSSAASLPARTPARTPGGRNRRGAAPKKQAREAVPREVVAREAPAREAAATTPAANGPAARPKRSRGRRGKGKGSTPAAAPANTPAVAPAHTVQWSSADSLAPIVRQLRSMNGKPATRKKLAQTIASYFKHHGGDHTESAVERTIDELVRRKLVVQQGVKVTYQLS